MISTCHPHCAQVIFVLLVTAVGSDFLLFVKAVMQNPLNMPHLLADQLPKATHFYMSPGDVRLRGVPK